MSDWVIRQQIASSELYNAHLRLQRLADAFCLTGNTAVGQNLFDIADSINRCREEIDRTTTEWMKDYQRTTQQNSENVLNAALAGIAISTVKTNDTGE